MHHFFYVLEDLIRVVLAYGMIIALLCAFWMVAVTKVFPRIPVFREIVLGLPPLQPPEQSQEPKPEQSTKTD